MKKLVVFVIIATIATFISAGMALACDKYMHCGKHRKAIHGEYAGTSFLGCNNYFAGTFFGNNTGTQLSTYTFNCDGTGTVQGKMVTVGFTQINQTASQSFLDISWDFTYEVADDGEITMDAVPETGLFKNPDTGEVVYIYTGGTFSDSGKLSVDHKTIILSVKEPNDTVLRNMSNGLSFNTKCNVSRVLIRVDK